MFHIEEGQPPPTTESQEVVAQFEDVSVRDGCLSLVRNRPTPHVARELLRSFLELEFFQPTCGFLPPTRIVYTFAIYFTHIIPEHNYKIIAAATSAVTPIEARAALSLVLGAGVDSRTSSALSVSDCVGRGVGSGVGRGVGVKTGAAVGLPGDGVGPGVGPGVGRRVGPGVGPGVGRRVGPGVGLGVEVRVAMTAGTRLRMASEESSFSSSLWIAITAPRSGNTATICPSAPSASQHRAPPVRLGRGSHQRYP